ncbi:hypothetical protein HJFPF1_03992 [Paramyrothecium foliicola]|nr:hypothetical protein HJFPF1_03992 [Paramyrothecium foliicola]
MQRSWKKVLLLCLAAVTGAVAANKPPTTFEVLAQMPQCAQTCVLGAVTNSSCSMTDLNCVCVTDDLQAAATECIKQNCSIKQGLFTMNLTQTSCNAPVRNAQRPYVIMSDTLGVFIGVSVLQRILAKLYWKLGIEKDDWCILVTTVLFVVPSLVINVYGLVGNGMGMDIWTLPFDTITHFSSWFHAMSVLYFTQISLIKLTLLFFYLRVFPVTSARYMIIGTMIFNCLYGVIYALVTIFQCLPVGYLSVRWDHEHEGSCINLNAMTWSNAGISIAVDVWMLCIPLLQVKSLQLDWKKKIGAGLMFLAGTAFTIISVIRLRVLVKFNYTENPTWTYIEISKWSTLEIAVGVICTCMPSYRLLFVRAFPRVFNSRHQFTPNESSNSSGSYSKNGKLQQDTFNSSQTGGTAKRTESRTVIHDRSYGIQFDDLDDDDGSVDQTGMVYMRPLDLTSESKISRSERPHSI